ncbi:50S ribosomal protein L11 methyltransferase [Aridibaculum aurantiacum]|uniref:50S ribosomal protein L11 methyltransferase n=1 Tax=Aridibaculum aurantiacum TaxID=2810307 RepID=UPI001A966B65|nr:50S ribosomal protein L11 methyltransferase [Aridibaculum aurantiacum]
MADYLKIEIPVTDAQVKDQLLAVLSLMDFEGFEETDTAVLAYQEQDKFEEAELKMIIDQFGLTYSVSTEPQQNWNALWESNFDPVVVEDFCAIRAHFHEPIASAKHEILITPKMSFGTGHHATTYLMVKEMSQVDFDGKVVADFGTGTGILAILAEKLGAKEVVAIDYDEWSIENTKENVENNGCSAIAVLKLDHFGVSQKFDIILANINKNVILDNLAGLANGLASGGLLLLSGLLKSDETEVIAACEAKGLKWKHTNERNNWITIMLSY